MTLHPNQEPREQNQPLQLLCADVFCIHLFPNIRDLLEQGLGTSSFFQPTVLPPSLVAKAERYVM